MVLVPAMNKTPRDIGVINFVVAEIPYIRPLVIYDSATNFRRWGVGFAFNSLGIFATTIDNTYTVKHVDSDILIPVLRRRFYRSRICLVPASFTYDGAVVSADGTVENELPPEAAAMISQVVSLYSALAADDDDNIASAIARAITEALSSAAVLKTLAEITLPPDADCDNETINKVVAHTNYLIQKLRADDFISQFESKYHLSLFNYELIEKHAAIFLEHLCWGKRISVPKLIRQHTLAVKFL